MTGVVPPPRGSNVAANTAIAQDTAGEVPKLTPSEREIINCLVKLGDKISTDPNSTRLMGGRGAQVPRPGSYITPDGHIFRHEPSGTIIDLQPRSARTPKPCGTEPPQ